MSTKLFDLTGKTALITGSSRGLGLVMAKGLGQAGATVILNGRHQDTLDAAVKALADDGIAAHGFVFDVCDKEQVRRRVALIEESIGAIDILINNAGIQIRSPLEEFEEDNWQKIIDTNLTSAFIVSKYVAQKMIARRRGKIINICSMQSELGRPTISPYAASKGGLKMLTKGMAAEWGKYNIQVNGIGPGYFITEMTQKLVDDEKFNAWLCGRTPANRWGDPKELIGAAIFLSSAASSYVNGHILYVDGGMLACV